ncbi:polysaccharide deacetylase family protein [Paenibacillus sp. 481]|uniref:polysaccharide deacetylase family protein n=1 Tax=Paenibacillus sp. 481 TaxID=2835869 RepID=UPI001E37BA29|nr:polysaccharide deacetylase family protein [Paenibacillus sp. 481]UHA74808.1 polysaccharide deacetylase family protein [Paenibacillus sp. 481]
MREKCKKISYAALSIILCFTLGLFPTHKSEAKQQAYYKDKVIVLLYHHVADQFHPTKPKGSTVLTKQFRSHLKALQDNGYEVISMDDYIQFALHDKPVPDNAVLLTFDDGYESFYTKAYPILQQYEMPATHFIVGYDTDLYNSDAYSHLTWDQMRDMKQNGMSFFNHTYNMHKQVDVGKGKKGALLSNRIYLEHTRRLETEAEYKRRIQADLVFMEKRLQQELGQQPMLLAFPYGAYNSTVLKMGEALGFKLFFSLHEGINDRHTRNVKRINAGSPNISAEQLLAKMKKYHQKQAAR